MGVVGPDRTDLGICREVRNHIVSRIGMGRPATDGESPVGENNVTSWNRFPSTTGHVESCGNLGGPSPKAKHCL